MTNTEHHSLNDLPEEILLQIFKYLSPIELLELQLVNRKFCDIVTPLLWRSIYVYDLADDVRAGRCWRSYWWISMGTFLHLARSRELKTEYMKTLVFCNDDYVSLAWLKKLKELCGCRIIFSRIINLEVYQWFLGSAYKQNLGFVLSTEGYQYIVKGGPDGYPNMSLLKSVRIDTPLQEFYDNLPNMTLLRSLHIENPAQFTLGKKICLKNLCIARKNWNYRVSIHLLLQNFELSSLESLLIPEVEYVEWRKLSQELFSIKEIELQNSIVHLPFYSLREVHYLRGIPPEDFRFLSRHLITYLSVASLGEYDLHRLDKMKTLKKVKVEKKKYLVNKTKGITKYIEIFND